MLVTSQHINFTHCLSIQEVGWWEHPDTWLHWQCWRN